MRTPLLSPTNSEVHRFEINAEMATGNGAESNKETRHSGLLNVDISVSVYVYIYNFNFFIAPG
jgi:hypothetical protein